MILQHNMAALNSHRMLGINNKQTGGNLEKLSSGYRANRAGDDAAGLAISEKMRGQIRGLSMAAQNTENGVSLIQTAEGGLNEVHAILHRMRELGVQASNGTYQDEDREAINLEAQALKDEIDRIANSTHFNGIKLLDGTTGAAKGCNVRGADTLGEISYDGSIGAIGLMLSEFGFQVNLVPGGSDNYAVVVGNTSMTSFFSEFDGKAANLIVTSGKETGGDATLAFQVGDKTYMSTYVSGPENVTTAEGATETIQDGYVFWDDKGKAVAVLYNDQNGTSIKLANNGISGVIADIAVADKDQPTIFVAPQSTPASINDGGVLIGENHPLYNSRIGLADSSLVFQIGANGGADQRVKLHVDNMSTARLGTLHPSDYNESGALAGISLNPREAANDALITIDEAVKQVSATRAGLGALQNRLEHTLNNLGVTRENLTAAESTIRDTDMAKEMMEFTKNNILVQASQAMLAQANQLPQGVLSLMR